MNKQRISLVILIILGVVYIGARAAWYAEYPPTRNYDHFNTETTLNILENPSLYPTDPIWKNGGQASSLGLLFNGFMQGMEAIFGEYVAAWNFLYVLHLAIYLPGAFLLFRYLTGQLWLAGLLAVASSIPLTLYFSYTSWGISSPYAATFTTVQFPWLMLALLVLLQKDIRPYHWWLGFAVWVGSTVYWNPVHGLALIQMVGFALVIEWLGGRIHWRELGIFVGIAGGLFAVYYLTAGNTLTSRPDETPLTDQETKDIIQGWIGFAGLHFFPWAVTKADALRVVLAASLGSLLLLLSAPLARPKASQGWWLIGLIVVMCQVPAPIIMTRDTSFLLIAGYWIYKYRRIDRWDVLWLSLFTAVNLASVVQSALGYYLFAEMERLSMVSVAFESYRPIRWAFPILFVVAGRWVADLLSEDRQKTNSLHWLAAAFILGSTVSRLGNIGLDDMVVVRPDEDLRHALPFLGFGLAMLAVLFSRLPHPLPRSKREGSLKVAAWSLAGLGLVSAIATAWSIPAFKNPSAAMWVILGILLLGFGIWLVEMPRRSLWQRSIFGIGVVALVLIPISTYYQQHDNANPPEDFSQATTWARENTPPDALFLVVGLDPMPFRAQSERSVLTWDVLQTTYFLGMRQLLEANQFLRQYAKLDPSKPDEFRERVDNWGVDYILAANSYGTLPYPTVFESGAVTIYAVEP